MKTIQELAMSVAAEMTAAGYTQNTAWQLYIYALRFTSGEYMSTGEQIRCG